MPFGIFMTPVQDVRLSHSVQTTSHGHCPLLLHGMCHAHVCLQVEVPYRNIKEIRTAPRALGLWGDCVIFLKDGSRLEITGLEKFQEIKRHILSCIVDG